jgi:acyl-CoA thioesterase
VLLIGAPHLNNVGVAHGGVIFSLADKALAVAANAGSRVAVAAVVTIHFLTPAREGDELIAAARPVRTGRSISVFAVDVRHEERLVATAVGQAVTVDDRDA